MGLERTYTFDDILLVPNYADFEREDVNIGSSLFDQYYELPIISSPMDTITGINMAEAMKKAGGLGVHHRYCKRNLLESVASRFGIVAVSPSMGMEFIELLLKMNHNLIAVMDIAHGDTKKNVDFCAEMVKAGVKVVSGNIVTPEAVERYLKVGINTFRIGIGSGSVCTTRTVAGVGFPQASAIKKLRYIFDTEITIISDGGHKTTGDIVKALALGADFVMLGGMLAGTDEAEGTTDEIWGLHDTHKVSTFRGMASKDAVFGFKGEHDTFIAEGINKVVESKGTVVKILKEIENAIRLGCYYTGSRNLDELRNAGVTLITENGYREGLTR